MKIVFMGTPDFSVPILKALSERYEVALVISQPNRVKKKGQLIDTPVASLAKELNLKLIQPEKIKDAYEIIKEEEADVLVTAAYGQFVPTKILKLFHKCLNVHASLLPLHRGGAPIQRCLMEGDKKTGVTIMEMTKELDAGQMYAHVEYEITPGDNATRLFNILSLLGRNLIIDNIEGIVDGSIQGVSQDESRATVSPNILPIEEQIDLNNNAVDVVNKIRGLSYEPGAYLIVNGIKIKILKATVLDIESKPGYVVETKKKIVLGCKDKSIELLEVLYPGKKLMSGKDFSNGQKIFIKDTIINS